LSREREFGASVFSGFLTGGGGGGGRGRLGFVRRDFLDRSVGFFHQPAFVCFGRKGAGLEKGGFVLRKRSRGKRGQEEFLKRRARGGARWGRPGISVREKFFFRDLGFVSRPIERNMVLALFLVVGGC